MTAKSTGLVSDTVEMPDLNDPLMNTSPSGVTLVNSCAGSTVAPVIMEASSPLTRLRRSPVNGAIQAVRQSFQCREVTVGLADFTCYLFLKSLWNVIFYSLGTKR